jgi:hypothetical protein
VDIRASLDGCENCRSPPGFDPRTVQPVSMIKMIIIIIIIIINVKLQLSLCLEAVYTVP